MNGQADIPDADVEERTAQLTREAETGGYHINPDNTLTPDLVRGLIVNEQRYGYPSCPCRLASGDTGEDLDIVCPCYYRDPDLEAYGMCYCGLYVSRDVLDGKKQIAPIPERRPPKDEREKMKEQNVDKKERPAGELTLPVWRCRVCGYLCARDAPPETCPICKAKKERFERFM